MPQSGFFSVRLLRSSGKILQIDCIPVFASGRRQRQLPAYFFSFTSSAISFPRTSNIFTVSSEITHGSFIIFNKAVQVNKIRVPGCFFPVDFLNSFDKMSVAELMRFRDGEMTENGRRRNGEGLKVRHLKNCEKTPS